MEQKHTIPDLPDSVVKEFDSDLQTLGVSVENKGHRQSLWQSWSKAIKRWRAAGKPVRTEEEMQTCLAICTACDKYDKRFGVFGYCTVCGCNVSATKIGELNKIRMKTEVCPLGKWK